MECLVDDIRQFAPGDNGDAVVEQHLAVANKQHPVQIKSTFIESLKRHGRFLS